MSNLGGVLDIPQPKTYGFLGNLPLIDRDSPTLSFCKLAQEYGPIFRFSLFNRSIVIVSAPDLVADVCDESRFDKAIGHLMKVRDFAGDGLFTSRTANPLWKKAHNILLPSFSLQAMKGYHAMMVDIALQLVQKWERLNPNEWIDVPDDMTRLTLDTIGLCGFSYRFNSYYRETPNPFIVSMVRALDEAMHYGNRLPLQNSLMWGTKRRYERDIQTMYSLVDRLIAERKASGDQGETDLLARMLHAKDPETGERLDDENIRFQIITFLIAGHETTSGLLSFALYFLLKHPDVLQKAREEADTILGGGIPTYEQVLKLSYVRMVLNESLRLWPTAPQFSLFAKQDTTIAGRYPIKQREAVSVLLPQLHRDRGAWGEDAELFRPERFADPGDIPANAYKPFGNGQRACIGMQFALHEATLVLGMILQHFDLVEDGGYELKVRQTLTLKPEGFRIRVRPRMKSLGYVAGAGAVGAVGAAGALGVRAGVGAGAVGLAGAADTAGASRTSGTIGAREQADKSASLSGVDGRPLLVLFGSNMGTAEGLARELADLASSYGIAARVQPLDERVGDLPKEGAVLIVTSSYNGRPPANARKFAEWVGQAAPGELEGVRYAVFGCGDRNWASTYQDVPRWIDEQLMRAGATRFAARGEADASGDFEQQYEQWKRRMWTEALQAFGLTWKEETGEERGKLDVEFVGAEFDSVGSMAQVYQAVKAKVLVNRELQAVGSGRSTRHLELELPPGVAYHEGDHLGVIPVNRAELVKRILRRFRLEGGEQVVLSSEGFGAAHLPLDRPVRVDELFKQSVELQEPASRAQIRAMAASTVCPPHKRELEALLEDEVYRERVLVPRVTMLELLERYEACELPFARLLELLPPLSPRFYSISSSPVVSPAAVSLTVGVVCGPAWSGAGDYRGVASNYLAECREGESVAVFVRTPESGFKPPEDPAAPVIMVGPGTGVAPFRGFLQARAARRQEGTEIGVAHLFFGCRNEADFLYRDELEKYASDEIVTLHVAFSRKEGQPKTYVQHLMEQRGKELVGLLDQGGRLFVCGDASKMAPEVEATLCRAYQAVHRVDEPEARNWLDRLQEEGRYAKDVWSGS